jgi:hypothetical protein
LILKIEDIDSCENLIEDLIKINEIDAVFAVNELFAVTAIKAALKHNINVPEDFLLLVLLMELFLNIPHLALALLVKTELKWEEKQPKCSSID